MRPLSSAVMALLLSGIALQLATRDRGGNAVFRLYAIEQGDTLPALALHSAWRASDKPVTDTRTIAKDPCSVLIFFHSGCPACDLYGPQWSGVDTLTSAGRAVPVRWIGLQSDTGAVTFLKRHSLAHGYLLASWEEFGLMGVRGTPIAFVVKHAVFLSESIGAREAVERGIESCTDSS